MNKKEAICIFFDFVTGKISTDKFWDLYKNDIKLQNILIKDGNRKKGIIKIKENGVTTVIRFDDKNFPYNPDNLLNAVNINNLEDRYELFIVIKRYLTMRGINVNEADYNIDAQEYLYLKSILPDYVEINDMTFLKKILSDSPPEYNKNKKLSWCRNKIKEMFEYEDKPPQWCQEAEWPMINGIPLVFSHQETTDEGIEKYYFYDRSTKKTTIIEQLE